MLSTVHTHHLGTFLVKIEGLGRMIHRVEMVSRPNNWAVLGRGHGWKLNLGSQVFFGKLTIKVALGIHELLVNRAAPQMLLLLLLRSLFGYSKEILGLFVINYILKGSYSWNEFA